MHHNPYIDCPYNKAHQVPKLRIQRHLLKCRKNNPELTRLMKTCPFNATHIMPETELQWHLRFCADRSLIEGDKYNLNTDHGELGNPTFHPPVPKGNCDDWDDSDDADYEPTPRFPTSHNASTDCSKATSDPYLPGGALGISIRQEDSNMLPNFMGLGRGRVKLLLEKMKNESM